MFLKSLQISKDWNLRRLVRQSAQVELFPYQILERIFAFLSPSSP